MDIKPYLDLIDLADEELKNAEKAAKILVETAQRNRAMAIWTARKIGIEQGFIAERLGLTREQIRRLTNKIGKV